MATFNHHLTLMKNERRAREEEARAGKEYVTMQIANLQRAVKRLQDLHPSD